MYFIKTANDEIGTLFSCQVSGQTISTVCYY